MVVLWCTPNHHSCKWWWGVHHNTTPNSGILVRSNYANELCGGITVYTSLPLLQVVMGCLHLVATPRGGDEMYTILPLLQVVIGCLHLIATPTDGDGMYTILPPIHEYLQTFCLTWNSSLNSMRIRGTALEWYNLACNCAQFVWNAQKWSLLQDNQLYIKTTTLENKCPRKMDKLK